MPTRLDRPRFRWSKSHLGEVHDGHPKPCESRSQPIPELDFRSLGRSHASEPRVPARGSAGRRRTAARSETRRPGSGRASRSRRAGRHRRDLCLGRSLGSAAGALTASADSSERRRSRGTRRSDGRLSCRRDAFNAVASAASPLTRSFQSSSRPLRWPLRVSFSPSGVIVTTQGSRSSISSRRSGFSSRVVMGTSSRQSCTRRAVHASTFELARDGRIRRLAQG